MIDTAMLPWQEIDDPAFTPTPPVSDHSKSEESHKYHSGKDRDLGPPVSRFPNFKSYDNLTIDSEMNDDQLFLCSYYVFGYVFSVREWGSSSTIPCKPYQVLMQYNCC